MDAAGSSRPTRSRAAVDCSWAARSTRIRGRAGRSDPRLHRRRDRLYNRLLTASGGCPSGQRRPRCKRGRLLPTQVRILLPPFRCELAAQGALCAQLRAGCVAAPCRDRQLQGRGACSAEQASCRPRSAGSSASSCRAPSLLRLVCPRRCCRASASRRASCAFGGRDSVHCRPELSTEPRLCFFGIRSLRAAGGLKV